MFIEKYTYMTGQVNNCLQYSRSTSQRLDALWLSLTSDLSEKEQQMSYGDQECIVVFFMLTAVSGFLHIKNKRLCLIIVASVMLQLSCSHYCFASKATVCL